ncbi:hypothetical protein ACFRMQ_32435, partial [Kitasatospora sp. NPDC056783]|uniref:hypothetical protein n=1 Tax=Kitasatospora sp. NPDC056783 TaxID=3345943 RepID=UPI00369B48B6
RKGTPVTMDLRTAATIELAASDANQEATTVGERAALTRLEAVAARARRTRSYGWSNQPDDE